MGIKPTFLLHRRLLNRRSTVFQKFKPQNVRKATNHKSVNFFQLCSIFWFNQNNNKQRAVGGRIQTSSSAAIIGAEARNIGLGWPSNPQRCEARILFRAKWLTQLATSVTSASGTLVRPLPGDMRSSMLSKKCKVSRIPVSLKQENIITPMCQTIYSPLWNSSSQIVLPWSFVRIRNPQPQRTGEARRSSERGQDYR